MRLISKVAVVVGLLSALGASITVAVTSSQTSNHIEAAECQHSGHHYTAKQAGYSTTGIREYWVCCNCHEHYLYAPSKGTWTDAGQANITIDSNDDRFIPKTSAYDEHGFKYSADGKTITSYQYSSSTADVVIPEGVTDIGTVFAGKKITSIVIPSTVPTIEDGAFEGCTSLKTVSIAPGVEELESSGTWPVMTGAFKKCTALQWVVIPATVTELGAYSFTQAPNSVKFFCEVESKPSGWSSQWNYSQQMGGSAYKNVYWGLGKTWHYDTDGITPIVGK